MSFNWRRRPFPEGVLREVPRLTSGIRDIRSREEVQGVTIDGPETFDLDDAIWARQKEDGGVVVTISVSDVSALIPKDSPSDREAYLRVRSEYSGSFVRNHMFHHHLALGTLSLLSGEWRPTMSVEVEFDKDGTCTSSRIFESCLKSAAKLSPDEVGWILVNPNHRFNKPLSAAEVLAHQLYTNRRVRGVMDEELSPKRPLIVASAGSEKGYHIVEELMILANRIVAEHLHAEGRDALYKNHSPGGRSFLGIEPKGHDGLGLGVYMQATSPIRQYSDLMNQRILESSLKGEAPPYTREELEEKAERLNRHRKSC